MRATLRIAAIALLALFAVIETASAQGVRVATLDRPPYTGRDLPRGGATTEVVRRTFEREGYDVEVVYVPWKRAIAMAKNNADGVAAYFPGYHCRHAGGFIPSGPIGNGPLGFAQHADAPIAWTSLDDIVERKLKIGTVLGYANTDEFDAKAGAGRIRAIQARDDLTNLKKPARQRIDAAVIDRMVLAYLLATEPALKRDRDKLQFNGRPLEEKTLYLCFNETGDGPALRRAFNAGLAGLDVDGLVEAYFSREFE